MNKVSLYYKEGGSDKVYQVELLPKEEGWVVNFAFGRRGSTLSTGTKTSAPIGRIEAEKIFERLVAEKMKKGYRQGESAGSYTVAAQESTGVLPQLLNPLNEDEAENLLEAPNWLLQEKLDGRRLLLRKQEGVVTGINRRGVACGIPEHLLEYGLAVAGNWLLDGELVGNIYHVFDLLEWDVSYRKHPLKERLGLLIKFLATTQAAWVRFVPSICGKAMKRSFFENCREAGVEGVVFKRWEAPYTPGRPESGGDQRKFKFVATASVVVTAQNGKRSVQMGLYRVKELVPCGSVTIPVGQEIPEVGQVVEVRYLYAFPESGALFQPVYLGVRDDIIPKECSVRQLKFKREAELAV